MQAIRLRRIVASFIALGLLGIAFWASRIPYQEDRPVAPPAASQKPAPPPLAPIFLAITSPTNQIVDTSSIQLKGWYVGDPYRLTYEIANAQGYPTNQPRSARWNLDFTATTTNRFEFQNVRLGVGTNYITVRADFVDDRVLNATSTYILDLESFTNPPAIKVLWPSNKTVIAGSAVTLQVQLADPATTIHVSVVNPKSPTLEFEDAIIDANGLVTAKDIPLGEGTNQIILTAKNTAGSSAATNLNLVRSPIEIHIRPILPEQISQRHALVSGWISNPSLAVLVNGQRASVAVNGQWTADNVALDQGRSTSSPETSFPFPGNRRLRTVYLTVTIFEGKVLIATQRFEAKVDY